MTSAPDGSGSLSPGDIVVRRDVHRGRIWSAVPMVVIDDGADELVAVRVPGSPWMIAAGYPGFDRKVVGLTTGEWDLEEIEWQHTFAVHRVRPGRAYNLIQFFDAVTLEFQCWYVNFERPVLRHADGRSYDTLDLELDLVVLPTHEVTWKDTDHWSWARTGGVFGDEEIAQVEAARDSLTADARSGTGDFDGAWTRWKPASAMVAPRLPEDWDRTPVPG